MIIDYAMPTKTLNAKVIFASSTLRILFSCKMTSNSDNRYATFEIQFYAVKCFIHKEIIPKLAASGH